MRNAARECLGYTEVENDRMTFGYENVLGLDVAVNDSLCMRIAKRFADIAQNSGRVSYRKLPQAAQVRAQVFTCDERHRIVEQRVSGACS